jgi:hypothetical protein
MQVLDWATGLTPAARDRKEVTPEHFASVPMQAAWAGLAGPGYQVVPRAGAPGLGALRPAQRRHFQPQNLGWLASYALVAANYAHLLLRFGYHFAVVDALAGERPEENHIQFRFKGGGGSPEKKGWRLAMLTRVLTHYGFGVKVQEDMLEAKCDAAGSAGHQLRLNILGYMLGRTPLLDMALESREHALRLAEEMQGKWRRPIMSDQLEHYPVYWVTPNLATGPAPMSYDHLDASQGRGRGRDPESLRRVLRSARHRIQARASRSTTCPSRTRRPPSCRPWKRPWPGWTRPSTWARRSMSTAATASAAPARSSPPTCCGGDWAASWSSRSSRKCAPSRPIFISGGWCARSARRRAN